MSSRRGLPSVKDMFLRQLQHDDLYDVPRNDETRAVEERLSRRWRDEEKEHVAGKLSLFRVVLNEFKWDWMIPGIFIFLSESIKMLQPFFVGRLISFFSSPSTMSESEAYLYGAGICAGAFLQVLCNPFYFFTMSVVGSRMRTALAGLIYKKVISLNSKSFSKTTSGSIVNLLSTDIENLAACMGGIHYLWICPVAVSLSVYLIYRLLGLSIVFGVPVIVVYLPLQAVTGILVGRWRFTIGKYGDTRVHIMTEILSGIKVIKMYCWEKPFSALINSIRSFCIYTAETSPKVMALLMFTGHWLLGSPPVALQHVFMILGWLTVLKWSCFYFFFDAVEGLTQIWASVNRIQNFLTIDVSEITTNCRMATDDSGSSVEMKNVFATWDRIEEKTESSVSERNVLLHDELTMPKTFSLKDLSLDVKKGQLVAIVGTVGSGKSSVLATLLQELPTDNGNITINGSLSYSCQDAWVFSGSVRDNVLFGDDLNEPKYQEVIAACALAKDIALMPHGDQSLVGERGLLLSGGQKARITLARCIRELLGGKTRILVTHQLQYLEHVEKIVVMENGRVVDTGTYNELRDRGLSALLKKNDENEEAVDRRDTINAEEEGVVSFKLSDTAEAVEEEYRGSGSISLTAYTEYFKAGKGLLYTPAILFGSIMFQSLLAFSDWNLAKWSDNDHEAFTSSVFINNQSDYNNTALPGYLTAREWLTMSPQMKIYIFSALAHIFLGYCLGVVLYQMPITASKNLHNKMFRYILGARPRFFDQNPVGRVLNRFARDIGFLDTLFGKFFSSFVEDLFLFLVVLILTLIVSPWLIIPAVPVLITIILIRQYAVRTTRDVRRLEGIARSPVYSHVSDTIHGLQTIRAMKKQQQFYSDFVQYQNTHTSAWFLYLSSYRWFSVRTIFVVAVYTCLVVIVCLTLGTAVSRGLLALALSYCAALSEPFEFFIRVSAEMENLPIDLFEQMTSVERVVSYTTLDQEGPVTTVTPPPSSWPTHGMIEVKGVSLKYSTEGPVILNNLNFSVQPKEKIGIVGRTGAGKSSFIAALLRLTEPQGAVIIDGIDVTKIGLHELRSRISVIPQDPVLFTGTLRRNLDPFSEFYDDMLWDSLRQVQLTDKIKTSVSGLDMEVSESGSNFSVGERQLICLARALLRRNKILVLDEATANVDRGTDERIQTTIREQFRDCTVLTIAHRLHTVMDYDRILVLDSGVIQEFDTPFDLLSNENSLLYNLVSEMGHHQTEKLISLAKKIHESRC